MKLYVFREMSVDGFLARLSSHHPLTILLVLVVLHSAVSSKAFGQNQAATAETKVPRPNPTGADPKPENATEAILAAFDKYEVVGLGAAHGNKDLADFILNLLRNPALPAKVNIAVECGNALYQPILDRYIRWRRRTTIRSATHLAKYDPGHVREVSLLRRAFSLSAQDQPKASGGEETASARVRPGH